MKKLIITKAIFLFSLSILLAACQTEKESDNSIKTMEATSKNIKILWNGQTYPWEIKDKMVIDYTDKVIGFITSKDTISFKLASEDSIKVNFVINKIDTIQATLISRPRKVEFDTNYIEENKGKYTVFLPKVHELVNISIALTNSSKKNSNMVHRSDYYDKVIAHFDKFKNHPLLDSLNKYIPDWGIATYRYYFNIRMNACMYSFKDNNIVNNSPYRVLGFDTDNYLKDLIPLLEDFSEKSDFKTFYKNNEAYYQSLINSYHELVPINKMWTWVENKFSEKYDSYTIYFSPLIGGMHSTQRFSDNDFKETAMFINAPTFEKDFSKSEKKAILARVVFTEIDHNYVNPTTDKFKEINALLRPLDCWNKGTRGYNNSYATFNEYMTWAVFTLYLYDNFDKKTFEKRNKIETDFMVNGRGFIKYKEFNEFVLDWYIKNPNESLEKSYPEVIEWIKSENCK